MSERERTLRLEGEEICRHLGNGVIYRGPWLPDGPGGEFIGHLFEDKAVTGTSFLCDNIEHGKAQLAHYRQLFHAKPPVFNTEKHNETN